MIKRKLNDVAAWVNGEVVGLEGASINVAGVSTDTRTIQNGNLYIPLVGENFNGHDFVGAAIENGAVGALWQKNQPNPPSNIPLIYVEDTLLALQELAKNYLGSTSAKVVGITGSNGKTTTKDMVTSVLATTYKVQKTEGNYNNHIGLPLTILRLEEDTEIAVLEMGMSGRGEIELLSTIAKPDAAIITNIGESHLQDLGSREGISEAKFEITTGLLEDGSLVIHGDEPLLTEKGGNAPFRVVTFGSSTENDYYPVQIEQKSDGTYFKINGKEDTEFFIPVLGKHNINNALSAVAIAQLFDVSIPNIKKGLEQIKLTGMRTELIEGKDGVAIINDAYNASPTSMRAAIILLQDLKDYSRKMVVLGDMLELGENEETFHYEVGKGIDKTKIDYVFTFGALAKQIAEGAKVNFPEDQVFAFEDKQDLITKVKETVRGGDIVLVKGSRGMKLEEVVTALT
ncbi:UDP-N-acetylmuramoylalanyl-D-glutamyl-2,6-diaminopimelate-D-alanyl-D-alanine ligase [Halalkalibacter wakoensis JCM 9140]|uniref:UDP-N-acetylmuramoyl-tripeptide--D-alanyl-D-alanine ligase n=1 Tax=Halalkalibacter wakoensis JCM 9140 TaxID=1236970 RepID=W4Q3R5_9BACI|nr:UDP-N-acetylmuramoyl-tripeptide--D-alanyl-D-alanine ligase [Halalkalibacter wakoensis]GAE26622.1 UDP-N-acetylmuramoylalanyl-D-glutamyl-2,6-diaminopimelate-D-alanyl-D-alanine ligase [Halalkalibacter wakoensis JCM 9140]